MGREWPAGKFEIATPYGPQVKSGYVWKGLGLWLLDAGSPKGRRKPRWNLTHIGTGHLVGNLVGDVRTAFPVATDVADAGDWTFDGPGGWQNQFPDVKERMSELLARYPTIFSRGGNSGQDHEQARDIAMRRSA
jgi:hypothetical protein